MTGPGPRRKGRLTVDSDDGTATLVFERVLDHSPAHVWDAITTPEGLRAWLMCTEARIDGRAGGTIELVTGPAGYRSTGRILAWDPPRLFEYEWKVAPVPEMPDGEDAVFRYQLDPRPDGTTAMTVTYRRITRQTARGFLPGLHAFLDRLEAQLAGAPLPDWLARFGALRASLYREPWEGSRTLPR
jgi:uncharacterized protein YndB with AHSA1/START domain